MFTISDIKGVVKASDVFGEMHEHYKNMKCPKYRQMYWQRKLDRKRASYATYMEPDELEVAIAYVKEQLEYDTGLKLD
jgi:hypothetical protein